MTEHDIEINDMDAARREVGAALMRLETASKTLEDAGLAQAQVDLDSAIWKLRDVSDMLYEKIHPPQTT